MSFGSKAFTIIIVFLSTLVLLTTLATANEKPKSLRFELHEMEVDHSARLLEERNTNPSRNLEGKVKAAVEEEWKPLVTAQNVKDTQYNFKLGLGKVNHEIQWVNVVFDTSSIMTWLASTECEECSTTEGFDERGANHMEFHYKVVSFELGHIHGHWGVGDVYLDAISDKHVLNDLPYLVARKMVDFPKTYSAGSIGGAHAVNQTDAEKTSFVKLLAKHGIIEKKIATLHYSSLFSPSKESSWIVFGEASEEGKNQEYEYNGHVADGAQWFTMSTVAHIGDTKLDVIESFINTASSRIIVSKSVFNVIMDQIQNSPDYEEDDEKYCLISKFPDLTFLFSERTYIMKPSHYIGYDPDSGECWLNIEGKSLPADDVIFLGAPFLRTVNVVFDYEQNKIGLAPSNNDDPVYPEGSRPFFGTWASIVLIFFLSLGVVVGIFYGLRKRRDWKLRKHEKFREQEANALVAVTMSNEAEKSTEGEHIHPQNYDQQLLKGGAN